MSDAGATPSNRERGSSGEGERHTTQLQELHTGDIARVNATEHVLDPAAVIAVWPWTQEDFTPTDHPEIPLKDHKTLSDHRYDSDDDIHLWELNGTRVTFATEDGARYAAVDWNATDERPLLYLLVIESENPHTRRWDRVGKCTGVERYGEPEDRGPEWRLPSGTVPPWEAEQDAEPSFPEFSHTDD